MVSSASTRERKRERVSGVYLPPGSIPSRSKISLVETKLLLTTRRLAEIVSRATDGGLRLNCVYGVAEFRARPDEVADKKIEEECVYVYIATDGYRFSLQIKFM